MATHGPDNRVFALASVTKPLAAWCVLVAVQDGVVHLDEPAGPEGATVRHLLAHASGLPMHEGGPGSPVGKRRVYSNLGYDVLGELIEERTGSDFATELEANVLAPLGMDETYLDGSPAAYGFGTVVDLLRFARELLRPTLLDDELHREATSVQFPGLDGVVPGFGRQTPCDWGLGVEIKDGKSPHWTGDGLSPTTFGHFGQSGSFLWVDPELDAAGVFLCDTQFGDWASDRWPDFIDDTVRALREG